MTDKVSSEDFIKAFGNGVKDNREIIQISVFCENADEKAVADLKAELKSVIDARPQGEWKEWTDERWGGTIIYCPYCKEDALEKYSDGLHRQVKSHFCPNCGIKLEKGGTE